MTRLHAHKPKPDRDMKIVHSSARQRILVAALHDHSPSKLYMRPPRCHAPHWGGNTIKLCQSIWLTNQQLCTTNNTRQHPLIEGQLFAPKHPAKNCTTTCAQDHASEWATTCNCPSRSITPSSGNYLKLPIAFYHAQLGQLLEIAHRFLSRQTRAPCCQRREPHVTRVPCCQHQEPHVFARPPRCQNKERIANGH